MVDMGDDWKLKESTSISFVLIVELRTKTHICLVTDYCPGGELFVLLDKQPKKILKEDAVRFYASEVVIALEYLHCQGIIYRDLKPENVLLQSNGHVTLTDFDLSSSRVRGEVSSFEKKILRDPVVMRKPESDEARVGCDDFSQLALDICIEKFVL
ncbi:unnamed protein product [Rhodiola kirilowii]